MLHSGSLASAVKNTPSIYEKDFIEIDGDAGKAKKRDYFTMNTILVFSKKQARLFREKKVT